ncbi:hypothetical protein C7N43_36300, partial [Sphingobacteriales bacterium UPWRP_1]
MHIEIKMKNFKYLFTGNNLFSFLGYGNKTFITQLAQVALLTVGLVAGATFSVSAQITVTLTAIKDNQITGSSTVNNGASQTLDSYNSGGIVRRALYKFDLSGIPSGATITSASMNLYTYFIATSNTPVKAHRLTADWDEGTQVAATGVSNWTQRLASPATNWATAGGDFDPVAAASIITTGTTAGTYSFDIKTLAQSWVNGTYANHGVILLNDAGFLGVSWRSKEWLTASQQPKLVVTYYLTPCDPSPVSDGTGTAFYAPNSANTDFRNWTGTVFNAAGSGASSGNAYRVIQGEYSSTRNEAIVVGINDATSNNVVGQIWNGTSWSNLPINPLGTVAETFWWSADVTFENLSGDAMMAWADGANIKYSVWNGTAWSTVTSLAGGNTVKTVKLASKPGSDEIVMVYNTLSGDHALVWNGSSWGNLVNLYLTAQTDFTDIDVAYEQQTGRAMVVFGKNGDNNAYFRLWNGTAWGAETNLAAPASIGSLKWAQLASHAGSNRIALGVVSATPLGWVNVWNGSAWETSFQLSATNLASSVAPNVAVGFEGLSGQALVIYGKTGFATSFFSRSWTSGTGWSSETTTTGPSNSPNTIILKSRPGKNSDQIMALVQDGSNDLNAYPWDGSAFGTETVLTTNTGELKNQPFDFMWEVHIPAAPTLSTAITHVTTSGGSNGAITLTVTGGTAPFTYLWSNNATTQNLTALTAGTYTVTVTDAIGCTAVTSAVVATAVTRSIAASSDDAEEEGPESLNLGPGGMSLLSTDLEMTQDLEPAISGTQKIGLRFTNITIPPNAIITGAYLTFSAVDPDPGNSNTGATNLTIRGHKVANSTTFTSTINNITSRTPTTASVSWSPPAWTTGLNYDSPEIVSVIQEIINQGTWASGNSISIIITGTGSRSAASWDDAATGNEPKLTITYQTLNCVPIPPRAPLAMPNETTTPSTTPVTFNVLSNDYLFGTPATALTISTPPVAAQGTATANLAAGTVTFTPNATFNGQASFQYTVTTANGSDVAMAYVTVTNAPVVINTNIVSTNSNTSISIPVLANDYDPEGSALSAPVITVVPKAGTALVSGNNINYTPGTNYTGKDTLIYQVCESIPGTCSPQVLCDTALVLITVLNQAPTANPDTRNILPCQTVTINLVANDTDPENGTLTVTNLSVLTPSAAGTLTNNNDGTVTFTGALGFVGTATFTYTATDNGVTPATSAPATVTINVVSGPANNPPTPQNDSETIYVNQVLYQNVLENDTDPDGNSLAIPSISVNPLHGTATVLANGLIQYTPQPGYWGTDVLTYQVCDVLNILATCATQSGMCSTAQLFITVQLPNTAYAVNNEHATFINTPVSGSVLPNDFDLEGNNLIFDGFRDTNGNFYTSGTIAVTGGNLTVNPSGTYTFTPATNFTGTVTIPYVIFDNSTQPVSSLAYLTIVVNPINPLTNSVIANNDENVSFGAAAVSGNVTVNDRDPQKQAFSVSSFSYDSNGDGTSDATGALSTLTTIGGKMLGNIPVSNAGTITINSSGNYLFTPASGFYGFVDVPYTICDTGTPPACQTAVLHIEVVPDVNGAQNDRPFAADDFNYTNINISVTGNFINNDNDPNGNSLSLNGTTLVPGGAATTVGSPVNTTNGGTVQFYANGTYTYTPPLGYTGPDDVNYTVCDVTSVTPQPLCATALLHFLVGQEVFISGTVYHDPNGGNIDGTPTNTVGTNTLYVNLVNPAGNIVLARYPVNPDGTYTFGASDGVTTNTAFNIVLTNVLSTVGNAVPSTALVNAVNTAEGAIAAGDGTPNGTTAITVATTSIANVNFGVEIPPVANINTISSQPNPGGTTSVAVPASAFSGTDSDGTITSILISAFPSNATSITINGVLYTSFSFPLQGVTITANSAGNPTQSVSIDPVNGSVTVSIPYYTIDNAGKQSLTAGSANLPFIGCFLSAAATSTNVSCRGGNNGTATAIAGGNLGPVTYLWSNGATTATITGLTAGTYTVTITEVPTCTATASTTVTQPAASLTVSKTSPFAALNLTGSTNDPTFPTTPFTGGFAHTFPSATATTYNYSFTFNNSYIPAGYTLDPNWLGNGTLNYTKNDANATSNAAHSAHTRVTDYTDFNPGDLINTSGDVYHVYGRGYFSFGSATGALQHDWTETFNFSTLANGYLPAGTIIGFVDIDGTASNGENVLLTATPASGPNGPWMTYLDDGRTSLIETPHGFAVYEAPGKPVASYFLDGPPTNNSAIVYITTKNLTSITISAKHGITGGSYSVKFAAPLVPFTENNVSCFGGNNGSTAVSVAGGTSPYTYLWSNGGTTASISGLTAGAYTVVVTDANGCTNTVTQTITQPTTLTASITGQTDVSCNGGNNGSVTIGASGGTPGYQYNIGSGNQASGTFGGLTSGS